MEERGKIWSGAFVCIFNRNFSKMLLLSRNWQKKKQEGKKWEGKALWGNIGGSIESRETSLQACVREAREEVGISLNPKNLMLICVKKTPEFEPHKFVRYFYAASIDEDARINLNEESDGYGWFDAKSLPEKMLDSRKDILGWWATAKKLISKG